MEQNTKVFKSKRVAVIVTRELTGEETEYKSIAETARAFGYCHGSISSIILNKHRCDWHGEGEYYTMRRK